MLASPPLGLRCGQGLCATVSRSALFVHDGRTVKVVKGGEVVDSYGVRTDSAMPVAWACGRLDPRVAACYRAPFVVLSATRDRGERIRQRTIHMNPVGIPQRMLMTRKRLAVSFERLVALFNLEDMSLVYEAPSIGDTLALAGDDGLVEAVTVLAHPCTEGTGNVRIVVNGVRKRTVHAHDHPLRAVTATVDLVHTMSVRSTLVRSFRVDTGECVCQVRLSFLPVPKVCGIEACAQWVAVATLGDAYVVDVSRRTVTRHASEEGPKLAWTDESGELEVLCESGTLHAGGRAVPVW